MISRRLARVCALTILLGIFCPVALWSQDEAAKPPVPLIVELVFSTYDGSEISERLPYRILVNAKKNAVATELRMGIEAPVTVSEGSVQYRMVGTNISCRAEPAGDEFILHLKVERSSFVSETKESESLLENPRFRSLMGEHQVTLGVGDTVELSSATDPINGQQSRVEVTITAVQ